MKNSRAEYRTPGQLIEDMLKQRGWSKRLFAVVLGINESRLKRMLSGRQPLDGETALAIGEVFAIQPELLLEIQLRQELARARLVSRPDPGRTKRARLFGSFPVADLAKRGWLAPCDAYDAESVEAQVLAFFGAESLEHIPVAQHSAKKSDEGHAINVAQLAWLKRVQQIAESTMVGRFDSGSAAEAIEALAPLMASEQSVRKVPRVLAECGIKFALVETLPGARIDGVCVWADGNPTIGLTTRYDRIDNFWFVLRHELEHVKCCHGLDSPVVDVNLEGDNAGVGDAVREEERQANAAAAEFCVPQKRLHSFIARKSPFFSEKDILGFAKTLGVHPGIVAGQLQRQTGKYQLFRAHQVKIREILAPNAMTDGWGDVFPIHD